MDKARRKTNEILKQMERDIGRIYKNDPALKRVRKKYARYMAMVKKETKEEYEAYKADPKKKYVYEEKIKTLTLNSGEYSLLIKEITKVLAEVNQKALDISNNAMAEIYAINYNQVADDCKKVGIKVK